MLRMATTKRSPRPSAKKADAKASPLKRERQRLKLSLRDVAGGIGTDAANILRIEEGRQRPKFELARKLYDYFEGRVPMHAILDPAHYARHGG